MGRIEQRESALYGDMLDLMLYRNLYPWRNNTGAYKRNGVWIRYGKIGSGDLMGILPDGRHIEVEVKTPEGRLSEDQRIHRREIVRRHGIYIVAITPEELASKLREVMG